MQISGMSFTLTYLCKLCLFSVLLDPCPFCFLQYTALPACCNCSLFLLFRVCMGRCPYPTLLWSVPHFSCCWKPSPLQAHWGRWCHSCWLVYLQFVWGVPFPNLWWSFPQDTHCYKLSTLQGCWAGATAPAFSRWLVCLFTVLEGRAPPPLSGAQDTRPLCYVSLFSFFFSCLFIIQFIFFSFFPAWGSVCPGGYADLPRVVCGSTACHLAHLVVCFSQAG
jgi:hypothetical protein